jgi:hypothetical protein
VVDLCVNRLHSQPCADHAKRLDNWKTQTPTAAGGDRISDHEHGGEDDG